MIPLYSNFYEACQMMEKKRVPNEFGTFDTVYEPGAQFQAAVIKNKSLQAKIAEKDGVTDVYSVTTPVGIGLDFHDVFKRLSDDTTFRVTTNSADSQTPKVASFQFEQVTAERWDIPK